MDNDNATVFHGNLAAAFEILHLRHARYSSTNYDISPSSGLRVAHYTLHVDGISRLPRTSKRKVVGDNTYHNTTALTALEELVRRKFPSDQQCLMPDYASLDNSWLIEAPVYTPPRLGMSHDVRSFIAVPSRNLEQYTQFVAPMLRVQGIIKAMLSGGMRRHAMAYLDAMPLKELSHWKTIAIIESATMHALNAYLSEQVKERNNAITD